MNTLLPTFRQLLRSGQRIFNVAALQNAPCRFKTTIDKSRVPVLNEDELHEQFVKGTGPGGQSVNKSVNCVILCHVPTHTIVKCHESRLLHQNRRRAREMLIEKLDDLWNGEMSVRRQKEALEKKKKAKMEAKKRKLREEKKILKEQAEAAKTEGPAGAEVEGSPRPEETKKEGDYEEYGLNPWERRSL